MRALLPSYAFLLVFFTASEACMRVNPPTPGMPATPCKTCAANLIMVSTGGPGAKRMDDDSTTTTGACAMRTFTCKGTQASIEIFTAAGSQGAIDDGGTGTAKFTVTCNAAGTAWEANGLMVTAVECSAVPACRACDPALVMKTMNAANAKVFFDDQTAYDTGCAVRTFTCKGTMANIAVTSGAGMTNVGDGGTGTVMYAVTCNAAGMWTNGGQTVTAVECQETVVVPPACTMCAANLITVDPANPADPGSKAMDSDTPGMGAGGCLTRTFTCTGSNPVIEINGGTSMVTNAATATVVATCNAAGTGWESNGMAVTEVSCNIPCKRCAANIAITQSFFGMTTTTGATIDRTGACATWDLVCTGPSQQTWEINGGEGVFNDASDGTVDNVVHVMPTCDATGMFFTFGGINFMTADCSAGA